VNPSKTTTYAGLIIGVLAVSTASIFIRMAQVEAQALSIAAYRMALATVLLFPVVLFRFRVEIRKINWSTWWKISLGGLFLAIHFASWITSLSYTSVASSVVLVTTTPLWVAIFGAILLKERPSKNVIIGLAVALTGSAIVGLSREIPTWFMQSVTSSVVVGKPADNLFGNFLSLLGAWAAAGYMLIGRKVRPQLSLPVYTFLVYGISAALLLMAVMVTKTPMTGFHAQTYLWLLLLAFVPQIIGHSAFNWALKYIPASLVSIALLGEPIGSTILAALLLHENPVLLEIAGGVFILTGIYLSSRSKLLNERTK
jgi:drug/metabolite transporter (DMT)-like permease